MTSDGSLNTGLHYLSAKNNSDSCLSRNWHVSVCVCVWSVDQLRTCEGVRSAIAAVCRMSDFPNSHLHNVILNVVTSLKNMTKLCFSSCIYWYTLDLVCGSRYSRTGIITEVLIMQWWHIAQHTAQQYRIL